ncbi:MAG: amidohydrolase [Bacteroidetes bacterium]|nr:amidohydrolase [Bacteroidota bacterium]
MRKLIPILVALGFLVAALWLLTRSHHADMLLVNGVVHTVDPDGTIGEALAIGEGKILEVGTTADLTKRYAADTVLDLKGKAVYPGLVDAHAHLEGLGIALMTLDLSGVDSIEEVQQRVKADIRNSGGRSWVRGRGWDQNRWPGGEFPSRTDLDAVSDTVPVFLVRVDGHAAWVNSEALALAGITGATSDPSGGKIIRDASGVPTGVLVDNAIDLVRRIMPKITREERVRAVRLAVQECLKSGLTGVHDMGVDLELIGIYKELITRGEFPFRVYGVIDGSGPTWDSLRSAGPLLRFGDDRLTVRALKLYADGALGSRGAALIEPYADDPGNRGITTMSSEALKGVVRDAVDAGFQVCTHAIGDRANAITLDAYEYVLNASGRTGQDHRLRIEHVQVLAPGDIPRFVKLGVIPSMQPTHCTSDMPWAIKRLGEERARYAYAWRSLLDAGSIIPAGSDFPVEAPSPLLGFAAAVTRQDGAGYPPAGWFPEQRMTRMEALKGFTLWAARASFNEKTSGSIEEEKHADLTVLDQDIMKIPSERFRSVRVVMTVVGGEIAYTWEDAGIATR